MGIFEDYPASSWQVGDSQRVVFPIQGQIVESGGNRLVKQERAFRDGAKIDDTGSMARSWSFEVLFTNELSESGIEANPEPLYPNMLRVMVDSFDRHETGNLILPTVGLVRARAATYQRIEDAAERDTGILRLTFEEDNEDALDRASLNPPTVRATVVSQAQETTFSAQSQGAWDDDLVSLTESASQLESAMLAPGRAANDVEAQVRKNRAALTRVVSTQSKISKQVGGQFHQPRGSEAERNLRRSEDRQAQAVDERNRGRPRTKAFIVDVVRTNIFEVASRFDQDAAELLDLNDSRIADPFVLRRGDVVRVFETRPR